MSMIGSWGSLLVNHLWQSTLFAGAAWLLTLCLRKSAAQTRYWIWLAASMKFLIPFWLFFSIGSHIVWRTNSRVTSPEWLFSIAQISHPSSVPVSYVYNHRPTSTAITSIPDILMGLWIAGIITVFLSYTLRWRQVRVVKRQARALDLPFPIPVLSSPALLEPAVFGVVKPLLLLPEPIVERLTPAQLNAVLVHEICHLRRHDNLVAVLHMAVEAIFWFYPPVWWLGARLIEERERACDEAVLQSGIASQVYAEAIVEVCRVCLKSPLPCGAGVGGGNLNKRIKGILADCPKRTVTRHAKFALLTLGLAAISTPVLVRLIVAPPHNPDIALMLEQAPPSVEAVTVSPSTHGRMTVSGFPQELVIQKATLRSLIRMAYFHPGLQVFGGPAWLDSEPYELDIKLKSKLNFKNPWDNPMVPVLQKIVSDRFQLRSHREIRQLPVYLLRPANTSPDLQRSKFETCTDFKWDRYPRASNQPPACGVIETGPNKRLNHTLDAVGISIGGKSREIPSLTTILAALVGRPIVDQTGQHGLFDVHLEWSYSATKNSSPEPENPSLFTALQQQLGLTLDSSKGPVEVLIVDGAEKPSLN